MSGRTPRVLILAETSYSDTSASSFQLFFPPKATFTHNGIQRVKPATLVAISKIDQGGKRKRNNEREACFRPLAKVIKSEKPGNETDRHLQRGRQRRGGPQRRFYLLVLLLKDVCGLLKLMFSYTLDESSFVSLREEIFRVKRNTSHLFSAAVLW